MLTTCCLLNHLLELENITNWAIVLGFDLIQCRQFHYLIWFNCRILNNLLIKMAQQKKTIQIPLMDMDDKEIQITPGPTPEPVTWNQFQYKQFGNAPKIQFSGLSLIIMCPVLICAHIRACSIAQIPIIQFSFVTTLLAFLINYTLIIRKHQLMPFLPEPLYDSKLKRMCVIGVIGMIISVVWGWNGSGGILFAMGWQSIRGNKMGFYGYMLLIVIAGSLLMQQNFYWKKLIEFIPGVLFGSINATLFTLRQSSFYAIAHQFLLLCAIVIPMMFPAFHIIVPSIWQWLLMLICGVTILFTTLCTIKLMQTERVSVVMGVMSGILMIGTSSFNSTYDYVGTVVILVGVGWIIKRQYLDATY